MCSAADRRITAIVSVSAFTELPWTFGTSGNATTRPLSHTPWSVPHHYGDLLYCPAYYAQAHIRLHHHVIGIELTPGIVRTQFNEGPLIDSIIKSYSVYFLPAGSVIEVRKEQPIEFMLATIDPELIKRLFPQFADSDLIHNMAIPVENIVDRQLAAMAASIRRHLLRGERPGGLATDLVNAALAILWARIEKGDVAVPNLALTANKLRRALQFIEANYTRKIKVEDIAGAAGGISACHFAHGFTAALGQSPHQYIIENRLRLARDMLLHTTDQLAEIACATGFLDQAHMTETFRRKIGVTPAKIRSFWPYGLQAGLAN